MKNNWLKWLVWLSLGLGLLSVLLVCAGGLGNRLGIVHFRTALTVFKWGVTLALPAVLVTVATIVMAVVRGGSTAQMAKLGIALLASGTVFTAGCMFKMKAESLPFIHDITTDTENPPAFKAVLPLRADADNPSEYGGPEIAEQQKKAYSDVKPLDFPFDKARAFEMSLQTAQDLGWEIVDSNSDEGRIEATDTTLFFGFKDDVVIRLTPLEGGASTRIDVRSVSRVGKSDVGANAARIRKFLGKLSELIAYKS